MERREQRIATGGTLGRASSREPTMRLGIGGRLYVLVGLFAVGCALLAAVLIWLGGERAMQARRTALRQVADVAFGVLDAHSELAQSGVVSDEEARKRAFNVLSHMR